MRTVRPLTETRFSEGDPRFSPDGHWLAYVSNQSGRPEVYVQPFPGLGEKWRISTDGGNAPLWEPNGRELFYRNGDKLMAVSIGTEPRFVAGPPRLLFEGSYVAETDVDYDVAPDGRRFVMIERGASQAPVRQIALVQNWFTELQQRVPTR